MLHTKTPRAAAFGACLSLACVAGPRDGDPFGSGSGASGVGGDVTGTSGSAEAGEAAEASDDSGHGEEAPETDGVKLDVGAGGTGNADDAGPTAEGCNGVDLLFVIDNSGSMQPYQDALAATFPLFVDAIVASLPAGTDLHVGITSTSFGSPSAGGKGSSGCSNAQYDEEALALHYPPPSEPNGQNGAQGRLYTHAGQSFYALDTADDPSGLKAWFTDAAVAVGEQGSNWEMVSAGGAWIAHPDNAEHNAGFLRDKGSVLVLFILTDEYDNSPEDAQGYHDLVVDAKQACGGDLCVVTGGLMPTCVPSTPDNVLWQFVDSFGEAPIVGDIGSEDDTSHYPDVLGAALAQVIADTCEEIEPEG
jgi:hypothetical protein